ncbi:MAG: DUF1501 domain-containing protein [Verrucomicrobiota bacterium]
MTRHFEPALSRRDFLCRSGAGFGSLALASVLADEKAGAAPTASHRPARARNVIFVFLEGGPSHIDLFDPKPLLNKLAGQTLPDSFGKVITPMGEARSPLLQAPRTWKQHGQSGLWVSEWLPHIAQHADDICVIRSCQADGLNHVGSVCQMNTGSTQAGRPSLGSWVHYGLGSDNADLPSFAVLLDNPKMPSGGKRNWGAGFMPATYQGTALENGTQPIPNLLPPVGHRGARQRRKLDLLQELNQSHAVLRPTTDELEARINAHELAFRMQATAPEAVDLTRETEATRALYGLEEKTTHDMGRCCLMARRLVERGVRFVQIYSGSGSKWDAHSNIESNHAGLCQASDLPVAALLKDLKSRGLLDDTLVIWGGEFGRTPMSEKGNGRDHNPFGFTMWMAGGGVQGGRTIGTTDELGLRAVDHPCHIHDFHATILYALGLQHLDLTFSHNGRRETPTINEGRAFTEIFT